MRLFQQPVREQERKPGTQGKRNGIQEVVGSIPISSTFSEIKNLI